MVLEDVNAHGGRSHLPACAYAPRCVCLQGYLYVASVVRRRVPTYHPELQHPTSASGAQRDAGPRPGAASMLSLLSSSGSLGEDVVREDVGAHGGHRRRVLGRRACHPPTSKHVCPQHTAHTTACVRVSFNRHLKTLPAAAAYHLACSQRYEPATKAQQSTTSPTFSQRYKPDLKLQQAHGGHRRRVLGRRTCQRETSLSTTHWSFIDHLLVRIHFMIRWTGLSRHESLNSYFQVA